MVFGKLYIYIKLSETEEFKQWGIVVKVAEKRSETILLQQPSFDSWFGKPEPNDPFIP